MIPQLFAERKKTIKEWKKEKKQSKKKREQVNETTQEKKELTVIVDGAITEDSSPPPSLAGGADEPEIAGVWDGVALSPSFSLCGDDVAGWVLDDRGSSLGFSLRPSRLFFVSSLTAIDEASKKKKKKQYQEKVKE